MLDKSEGWGEPNGIMWPSWDRSPDEGQVWWKWIPRGYEIFVRPLELPAGNVKRSTNVAVLSCLVIITAAGVDTANKMHSTFYTTAALRQNNWRWYNYSLSRMHLKYTQKARRPWRWQDAVLGLMHKSWKKASPPGPASLPPLDPCKAFDCFTRCCCGGLVFPACESLRNKSSSSSSRNI